MEFEIVANGELQAIPAHLLFSRLAVAARLSSLESTGGGHTLKFAAGALLRPEVAQEKPFNFVEKS